MIKKVLLGVALALLLPTGAFAQTAGQSVLGFLLAQGSTYGSFTCPASATSPCFVQYGATLPTSGAGGGSSNVAITGPLGSQTSPNGVSVTIASDQAAVAVKQSTAANLNATVVQTPATYTATSALAANLVVNAAASKLTSFEVAADSTLSGAAWWIMIYDATSAPVDGAVTPKKCYAVPSGATGFTGAFNAPVTFSTGIVIGVSTTGCFTKTASTHAFISGDFQ